MADEIKISVDIEAVRKMPLETLDLIDDASTGKLGGRQMLDLLDAFVVDGVRGRGFSIGDLGAIAKALSEAISEQAQGGTSAAG